MKHSAAGRKRISDVWDHFELPVLDKDGNKRICCTHCRESLTYCDSTASLRKHLTQKHTFLSW